MGGWFPGPMRASVGSAMASLPVRLRVTLAFAGVMAVLLGVAGAALYSGLAAQLDSTIDQSLHSRTTDLLPGVRRGDSLPPRDEETWVSALPRPDPDLLPPPDSLFTVAQARASACLFGTPRFS